MDAKSIKAGCGSLTEEQFDQLSPILANLVLKGMSDEYAQGVACGLGFVALNVGDTVGYDFEKFIKNAYLNFMLYQAAKEASNGLAEMLKGMGLK